MTLPCSPHILDFQLFKCVDSPPGDVCRDRQRVMQRLHDTELDNLPQKVTDYAYKLKLNFANDVEHSANTGLCHVNQYNALLLHRSQCPVDTHFIEGLASQIKAIMKRGPRTQLPLLNSQISLVSGLETSEAQCCDLHATVVAYQGTDVAA